MSIAENVAKIRQDICQAAQLAGRDPKEILLCAATKMNDASAVRQAIAAGVGSKINCLLGGKTDRLHGEPLELQQAVVRTISDGVYVKKNPMGAGGIAKLGPTVLLQVSNVSIVVTGSRRQVLDDAPYRIVGIDWQDIKDTPQKYEITLKVYYPQIKYPVTADVTIRRRQQFRFAPGTELTFSYGNVKKKVKIDKNGLLTLHGIRFDSKAPVKLTIWK